MRIDLNKLFYGIYKLFSGLTATISEENCPNITWLLTPTIQSINYNSIFMLLFINCNDDEVKTAKIFSETFITSEQQKLNNTVNWLVLVLVLFMSE